MGYPLINGCHACAHAGSAIFTWNFTAQGKFLGTTFVGMTPPPLNNRVGPPVSIDLLAIKVKAADRVSVPHGPRCYSVAPMGSVSLLAKFFALAFSALLPLINPLGSALVLLGLVGDAPAVRFS